MRLDIVAGTRAGHFSLTVSMLDSRWEEPQEVDLLSLIWNLHCGETCLSLFNKKVLFNMEPFVKLVFRKFYGFQETSLNTSNDCHI